jgi:glycosyltransferase involved in cell wall biosynthesis
MKHQHHTSKPSIGVLIPYFNERGLLTDCLNSLAAQSDPPDEVIIYDDASSEPPGKYIPAGFPARVLKGKENRGPAFGRNRLLETARSQYIHFHDADDWFHRAWCERLRKIIANDPVDAVFTGVSWTAGSEPSFQGDVVGLGDFSEGTDLVQFCINHYVLSPVGTFLRERVLAIGGYREALWQAEDYEFHMRLAASGITFKIFPEPLVCIRARPDSRSQKRIDVWSGALMGLELMAGELPATYCQDIAEALVDVGLQLYRLGEKTAARRAFKLARLCGTPHFHKTPWHFRTVARLFGPEFAEKVGQVYRRLPAKMRRISRFEKR